MNKRYDSIYLSPHLDDAVLSCGAQIFQQVQDGLTVMVVTVMAGDPADQSISIYAQRLHDRWQIEPHSAAARRDEDRAACAILGVDYLHWDIPDCIYRRDPDSGQSLYSTDDDLFGDLNPKESDLIERIEDLIGDLPAYTRLYLPLTVGNHVDHQLVRAAAERKAAESQMIYYEEFPYILEAREELLLRLTGPGWTAKTIGASEAAILAKIEAIGCYQSQISTFFDDSQDLEQRVRRHMSQTGGERYWLPHGSVLIK